MITSLCNVWITITKSPRGLLGPHPCIFGCTVSVAFIPQAGALLLENTFPEENNLRDGTCNNRANKIPVTGVVTALVFV